MKNRKKIEIIYNYSIRNNSEFLKFYITAIIIHLLPLYSNKDIDRLVIKLPINICHLSGLNSTKSLKRSFSLLINFQCTFISIIYEVH